MTTFEFRDAEYVPPAGGPGRNREPNPFADAVKAIALKTDDKTGKPIAKAFTFDHEDRGAENGDFKSKVARFKRLLSEAGNDNDPRVTVKSVVTPVVNPVNKKESATKSELTFWTVTRQERPRKPKTGEAPAIETPAS